MEMDSIVESCDMRSLEGTKLQEIWNFLTKLKQNKKHAEEVRKLSLQLFDQLKDYHLCGETERFFLECAAILHDIGYAINEKKHHKHSLRLILQAKLPSIPDREKTHYCQYRPLSPAFYAEGHSYAFCGIKFG